MTKKTVLILIAVISAVILGIIWGSSNAGTELGAVKKNLSKLYSDTGLTQDAPKVRDVVQQVRAKISGNPYAQVTPELKTVFDAFLKAWKDANGGKLTRKIVETHQPNLDAQLAAYDNLKYNQLLAITFCAVLQSCVVGPGFLLSQNKYEFTHRPPDSGAPAGNAPIVPPTAN